VWDRTHALGARLFRLTALLSLVGLLLGEYAVYLLVVPALLTAVVTVVYSSYLYDGSNAELVAPASPASELVPSLGGS